MPPSSPRPARAPRPVRTIGPYRGRHRPTTAPLLRTRSVVALLTLVAAVALGPTAWSSATAITWFNTLCQGFTGCTAAGLGNAGYQNVYTQSFFGMYGGHNCTNYAAYRLKTRGIDASYLAGQGNGYQWGSVAASHGVKVDKSPQVGDIAWFDQNAGLSSNGHVAYVEAIDPSTMRIKVSEDNWGGDFDWRWYLIADVTGFIHFGGTGGSTPTPTPTPTPTTTPPPSVKEGDFVVVAETGEVYRIAGGAPVYVTTWSPWGGPQPTRTITAAQLAALPATPADGTFLQGTDGRVYRVAGGAPLYVSTWASFGGIQPTTIVDAAAVAGAGGAGRLGHLLAQPRTGTFVRNAANGTTYVVVAGAPLLVPAWDAYGGPQALTVVDPWELAYGPHLTARPGDSFVRGYPSGRIVHVMFGRPLTVTSWTPFGGPRTTTPVDDRTLAACDHLDCTPFGNVDTANPVPGGVTLTGWADEADRTGPVPVAILADGAQVATTSTGVSRPDVDAYYHHGTTTGFSVAVRLGPGQHTVCVRVLGAGAGAASTQLWCGPISVTAGSTVAVAPTRLLDTRNGTGAPARAVAPGAVLDVAVAGRGPVPASGVAAVLLNVTATQPTSSGWVTAFPTGTAVPTASNLSYTPGSTVPTLVMVPVGAGGRVSLYNGSSGSVQLITDVAGYVVAGNPSAPGSVRSGAPVRVLDTRTGLGGTWGAVTGGSTVRVRVAGQAGIPSTGGGSVALSVTTTGATGSGYVTGYPTGGTRPVTANVQVTPVGSSSGMLLVPLGPDGTVLLTVNATGRVHVIADVTGWASGGQLVNPGATAGVTSTRVLDTRSGLGAAARQVPAGGTVTFTVVGRGGVPASGVSAVVLTLTATQGRADGYLTAYPAGSALQAASNVNFRAWQDVPNLVVVPVGQGGAVTVFNGSSQPVDTVADVAGWITG